MEFARIRVLIKLLRVRGSTGRPPDANWHPIHPPANQETRRQSSGDCFYGGDLTEGMIRTKPGTIHTYIYYIQRRSPAKGGARVALGRRNRKPPTAPPLAPPPPSAEAEEVNCTGPGTEIASSFRG